MLVIVDRGARERRHWFALRAADQHAHAFRREVAKLGWMNQHSVGNVDVSEILGDLDSFIHGAPNERELAIELKSKLSHHLDSVHRRGEARDKETATCTGENLIKLGSHSTFAGRVSAALDIGGILKEGEHPLFPVFGELVQVKKLAVSGSGIHFEVAGV